MAKSETFNQDCLLAMREMPDKAFELAIVDVPYGIGENGSTNHSRTKLAVAQNYKAFSGGDVEPPSVEYFRELRRVSRNQIIFGANHFLQRLNAGLFYYTHINSPCWIVWDKDNGNSDFADCELAWTSFSTAVRRFKYRWAGMLQEDMANKEERVHPTQKPVALYKWLLTNYAKQGDKILDSHMGSQSSRIACYDLGFDYVGFEIDEDYYKAGCERFENHIAQARLFEPQEDVLTATQSPLF